MLVCLSQYHGQNPDRWYLEGLINPLEPTKANIPIFKYFGFKNQNPSRMGSTDPVLPKYVHICFRKYILEDIMQKEFKSFPDDKKLLSNVQFNFDLLGKRIEALEKKFHRYHALMISTEELSKSEKKFYIICSKCGAKLEE